MAAALFADAGLTHLASPTAAPRPGGSAAIADSAALAAAAATAARTTEAESGDGASNGQQLTQQAQQQAQQTPRKADHEVQRRQQQHDGEEDPTGLAELDVVVSILALFAFTLTLDEKLRFCFDALRRTFYPPEPPLGSVEPLVELPTSPPRNHRRDKKQTTKRQTKKQQQQQQEQQQKKKKPGSPAHRTTASAPAVPGSSSSSFSSSSSAAAATAAAGAAALPNLSSGADRERGGEARSGIGEHQMRRLLSAVVALTFPYTGRGEADRLVRQVLSECGFFDCKEALEAEDRLMTTTTTTTTTRRRPNSQGAGGAGGARAVIEPIVLNFDEFRLGMLTSPVLIQCLEMWMSPGAAAAAAAQAGGGGGGRYG